MPDVAFVFTVSRARSIPTRFSTKSYCKLPVAIIIIYCSCVSNVNHCNLQYHYDVGPNSKLNQSRCHSYLWKLTFSPLLPLYSARRHISLCLFLYFIHINTSDSARLHMISFLEFNMFVRKRIHYYKCPLFLSRNYFWHVTTHGEWHRLLCPSGRREHVWALSDSRDRWMKQPD